MIWKKVFPAQGGGAVRRWIRIRKEMFETGINQALQNNNHNNLKINESSTESSSNAYAYADSSASESQPAMNNLPMKPLSVFDFRRIDDAADARAVDFGSKLQGWRISDDEVLGGYSRATFTLIGTDHDPNRNRNRNFNPIDDEYGDGTHEEMEEREGGASFAQTHSQTTTPFIRWEGNIDTRLPPNSRAKRSGFCAIRCPEFPFGGIPVGNKYNALEIQCRSDGRSYTLNLKVQSFFPDDLYQSTITVDQQEVEDLKALKRLRLQGNQDQDQDQDQVDNNNREGGNHEDALDGFISVVLPFQDFILTSHGRPKATQRTLDGGVQLQHLGLTLMDGKDGPFQFDLAKIRLVNYSFQRGMIVNDYDEDDDLDQYSDVGGDKDGHDDDDYKDNYKK